MADARGKAWPLADADLTNSVRFPRLVFGQHSLTAVISQILELVQQAGQYKQLKKGANEGTPLSYEGICVSNMQSHSD